MTTGIDMTPLCESLTEAAMPLVQTMIREFSNPQVQRFSTVLKVLWSGLSLRCTIDVGRTKTTGRIGVNITVVTWNGGNAVSQQTMEFIDMDLRVALLRAGLNALSQDSTFELGKVKLSFRR